MKKKILIIIISIIVVLLGLIALAGGVYLKSAIDNKKMTTTTYTVSSEKVPYSFDNYVIAFLSDFHNAYYYDQVIDQVREMNPDVIVFGGDMISIGEEGYDNTKNLVAGIKDIAPIYYISGNHEKYRLKWNKIESVEFEKMGINMVDNKSFYLTKGRDKIHVYGIQDPMVDDDKFDTARWMDVPLQRGKNTLDKNNFNLLLMHRANYIDYVEDMGYDLALSGHMHGGMIRLPFVGGVVSPGDGTLFPEYTEGRYKKKDTVMIVSRGMDYQKNKMRILNPPEVLKIVLRKK